RASWPMAQPIATALERLSKPDIRPLLLSESPFPPNPHIDTLLGAMTAIPLEDGCIELAILPVLTRHDLDQVLEEFHRILVPGGTFFTTHPLPSDVVACSRLLHDLITTIPAHLLPFPPDERISLIRELDGYFAVMNVPRQDASFLLCQKENR
ncbi:MAG: class I SAM-dependent methyltransferase, partial [Methanomicrobiales archaeon]|nr:class I SAM-dependent methyltransferase [Methanomicrobiales archaeon]